MADNYLEKKMEEYKARPWTTSGGKSHKTATTLNRLLVKNRKYDKFDNTVIVREEHLKSIAEVLNKIELIGNIRAEDFLIETLIYEKPLSNNYENTVNHPIILGDNLEQSEQSKQSEHSKQSEQSNARAFIIVNYNTNQNKFIEPNDCATICFNLGIIAQSLLLRATEMGLNGNCIYFNELLRDNEQVNIKLTEEKLNQLGKNSQEIILEKEKSSDGTTLLIIAIGKGIV